MRFLIVNNDEYMIDKFITQLTVDDLFKITKSFSSGISELIQNMEDYDCLILSMDFPLYDDSFTETNIGLGFLNLIKIHKISTPVVIFSPKYVNTINYMPILDYILFNKGCTMKDKIKLLKCKLILEKCVL